MNENENINNLPRPGDSPDIPQFLIGDHWYFEDTGPYMLDFSKPYEAPQYTLSWNGVPFAPRGGIHAITGQAGNGKTMTLAQFMAALLCGEYGNLKCELQEPAKVLYIDTEMEESNTIAVKNRVLTMCGLPIGDKYDRFSIIMLREVPEAVIEEDGKQHRVPASVRRWRMVLKAIYENKPTVVFIDGLLDVVADFNDNKECQEIIYKCMQVASHYGISVWCIVHQNPGGEKLVGHLGSFLERKVTDVFQTKKDKDSKTGDVTFTVSQKKARGRDVSDWQFRVLPVTSWGVPEQIASDGSVVSSNDDKIDGDEPVKIREWIHEASGKYNWPMSRGDIKKMVFCEIGGQLNHDKQNVDLKIALNLGYLEQSTMKKNGAYMLQPPEDLPF